jgi:hypothetical protein
VTIYIRETPAVGMADEVKRCLTPRVFTVAGAADANVVLTLDIERYPRNYPRDYYAIAEVRATAKLRPDERYFRWAWPWRFEFPVTASARHDAAGRLCSELTGWVERLPFDH